MAHPLPLPKYHQIYLVLREQLHEGRFEQGLPSELLLMKEFGVARVTVRKALERLVNEGLITRTPGRGTTPVKPADSPASAQASGSRAQLNGLLENENIPSDVENIQGGFGNDTLVGSAGANLIAGGGGADAITGNAGNDTLLGDGGNDTLLGGDGNDSLRGGQGNDSMNAGNGNDTLDGSDAGGLLIVEVDKGGNVEPPPNEVDVRSFSLPLHG